MCVCTYIVLSRTPVKQVKFTLVQTINCKFSFRFLSVVVETWCGSYTHKKDKAQYALCDWCVFKRHNWHDFSIFALECELSGRLLFLLTSYAGNECVWFQEKGIEEWIQNMIFQTFTSFYWLELSSLVCAQCQNNLLTCTLIQSFVPLPDQISDVGTHWLSI